MMAAPPLAPKEATDDRAGGGGGRGRRLLEVRGLVKVYRGRQVVSGVSFHVLEREVVVLLGPNGAGKTTAVRIFTTLLRADHGSARVGGLDVARHPNAVKKIIGLTGQYAAVDEYLTGRENIMMVGQLYHLNRRWVRDRTDELLERFRLSDAADRTARTYSGGMRRRLDLAASLVASPDILFLDEPTTGLDPRSRLELWDVIERLVNDGTTVLLTTQYLEEADHLARNIVVIDKGRVIAGGSSEDLKDRVGGDLVEVTLKDGDSAGRAVAALAPLGAATVDSGGRKVSVPVTGGSRVLVEVIRALDGAGVEVDDLSLRRPTLDDVFLALTGHATPGVSGTAGGGS